MKDNIISVKSLQEKLNNGDPVFILDVRPSEERAEWRIGESQHVDVYAQLKAGDTHALDEVHIPENSSVVTVCAAGRTSLIAAEILRKKGLRASSLDGGMQAWNYAWNTAEITFHNGVKVIQVRRPSKGILSYVVGSGKDAIVIDASLDPEVYLNLVKENGWRIRYVTDTHIHADYISRTRDLAKASGAKHLFIDKAIVDFEYIPMAHGEFITFGDASLQFLHTPGHTWESATLKLADLAIFSGDTLFVDGIGRPDLKVGQDEAMEKAKSLYRSLNSLLTFDPSILVLPAHSSKTVLFDDKLIGESLSRVSRQVELSRETEAEFVERALSKLPASPPNYLTIAGLNKQGFYQGHVLADLEAGGNHCAVA